MASGEHDLVVRGGTVVDGTGAERRAADVAVDDGRITAVGDVAAGGREELDATGLLVTPGWVDVHTHYDGQVTWDPLLTPSSWQGVTTVVMGNCGVGFAPVMPDRHDWLIALMEGVEDIPGTALAEGISWGWESFPEYLDVLDGLPHAMDVAAQVPHGALRGYVMGDRGAEHTEVPTADEIETMGRLAADGVRAGALGFTTSRTVNHRSSDGRPTPSLTATADELLGIARGVGATGMGVLQLVADLVDLDGEFALVRAMAEVSGRPLSITTLSEVHRGDWRALLAKITEAQADGVPIRGQVASRPVGVLLGLEGRLHPLVASPTYQAMAALDLGERVARLRAPEVRATVLGELTNGGLAFGSYDGIFPLGDPPEYDPGAERSIEAVATREGREAVDVALDVMLERDGRGLLYLPFANYADRDFATIREMLLHPHTVPGLGDAGAHCGMICDGSMPTYLVSHWGRDVAEPLPLEWLVSQQTRETAGLVGLHDRGVLAPGYRADLNLIDEQALGILAPEMVQDLPAGGKRYIQRATGYRTTVVAGEVTFRDGESTGALPGRLIRGAQPAPT
ncbi:MAG TPA: amidohydrolase family protein [Acidimicrobiales bacterium]